MQTTTVNIYNPTHYQAIHASARYVVKTLPSLKEEAMNRNPPTAESLDKIAKAIFELPEIKSLNLTSQAMRELCEHVYATIRNTHLAIAAIEIVVPYLKGIFSRL